MESGTAGGIAGPEPDQGRPRTKQDSEAPRTQTRLRSHSPESPFLPGGRIWGLEKHSGHMTPKSHS